MIESKSYKPQRGSDGDLEILKPIDPIELGELQIDTNGIEMGIGTN